MNKILYYMGYNNLSFVMEQERKHWLLKTDKKKQIQDKITGDMYNGQIDNLGSNIIVETEKMNIKNDFMNLISFFDPNMKDIFQVDYSAFTYSSSVNGLLFNRITSSCYPLPDGDDVTHVNYKIKFTNCEEVIIPFGGDLNSKEVFATKWIKTNTPPKMLLMDINTGQFVIEKSMAFGSSITGTTWYYPLATPVQPLPLTYISSGVYETNAVDSDAYIGYPLLWFTCDQSNIGPTISFTNNDEQYLVLGNEPYSSKYRCKLYTDVIGNLNGTPGSLPTSSFKIRCTPKSPLTFSNLPGDFNLPISNIIQFVNKSNNVVYNITINGDYESITMSKHDGWTYKSVSSYEIDMDLFDDNCLECSDSPLTSIFEVHLDETIPFVTTTTDTGFTGFRGSSGNPSDNLSRYPHDLNQFDGLPQWIIDNEEGVQQHLAVYAIHNTPGYNPAQQNSRQTAGLLFDPGKPKTSPGDEFTNDERGRVYVLSGDDPIYENNGKLEHPKPLRTIARICDIPTSVMQLTGISGLSPTIVVDPDYVRSQCSYTLPDKEKLYNELSSRFVRPIAVDELNVSVRTYTGEDNDYLFKRLSSLEAVDLINHNNFRIRTNLNPMVDPADVELANIIEKGTNYAISDMGQIKVGGYSFDYTVTEISEGGLVESCLITPSTTDDVNLSNFNMSDGLSGITDTYGTAKKTGNGAGLKLKMKINHYTDIITNTGELYDDLYALVCTNDAIWMYNYIINPTSTNIPKRGAWTKMVKISEFEQSTNTMKDGFVSMTDSFMNSIIPSIKAVAVCKTEDGSTPTSVEASVTPSFINITDKTKTPIHIENNDNSVDLNKFYCNGFMTLKAAVKTQDSVIQALEMNNRLRYDSFIVWRWLSYTDPRNTKFEYGIVYRSFNNFLSSDYISALPENQLRYRNYVHTNQATTVVWNIDQVGLMMWIYNPTYNKHETYTIDSLNNLDIQKSDITWDTIDIRKKNDGSQVKLVDANGKLLYNILTNNPNQCTNDLTNQPIYQQPVFTQFTDLTAGTPLTLIQPNHQPIGNWQLTFPRVDKFIFTNTNNNVEMLPMKLTALRNQNTTQNAIITDEYGNNINEKSIVINESTSGISLMMFDTTTQSWINL